MGVAGSALGTLISQVNHWTSTQQIIAQVWQFIVQETFAVLSNRSLLRTAKTIYASSWISGSPILIV